VHYVGTDVDPETIEGNKALAAFLGKEVSLTLCPAQEFTPPPVDMVFTSPPYFSKERYSHETGQSWKLGGFKDWVEGFLRPLCSRAYEALPSGGIFALNITDVRIKGEVFPLVEVSKNAAVDAGFSLSEVLQMPLAKLNRAHPEEPILIFKKP
jgi:hypothetical protein